MTYRVNIHPADELAAIREEIAILDKRADELRQTLMEPGADLNGETVTASVIPQKRETVDRKAIIEALGEEVVAPFVKTVNFKIVKLTEKKAHAKT
jgi:hypothetical protein